MCAAITTTATASGRPWSQRSPHSTPFFRNKRPLLLHLASCCIAVSVAARQPSTSNRQQPEQRPALQHASSSYLEQRETEHHRSSEASARQTKTALEDLVKKQDKELRQGIRRSLDLVKLSDDARKAVADDVRLYVRMADSLRTKVLEFVSEGRRELYRMEGDLGEFAQQIQQRLDLMRKRTFYEPPANYGEYFFARNGEISVEKQKK